MFLWVLVLLFEEAIEAAAAVLFRVLMPLGVLDAEPETEDESC